MYSLIFCTWGYWSPEDSCNTHLSFICPPCLFVSAREIVWVVCLKQLDGLPHKLVEWCGIHQRRNHDIWILIKTNVAYLGDWYSCDIRWGLIEFIYLQRCESMLIWPCPFSLSATATKSVDWSLCSSGSRYVSNRSRSNIWNLKNKDWVFLIL